MYKLLIVIALISVVRSLDLHLGTKKFGKKIFDENVTAKPALWKRTKTLTVKAGEGEIISGIYVTDLRPKKDGVVEILEGGEKQKTVVLKLKSPAIFRGYYFHVEVFAQPAYQPRLPSITKDVSTNKEPKTTTTTTTEATSTITLKHVKSETTTKAMIPISENVPVTEVEIVQTTDQNSRPLVPVEVISENATEVEAVPTTEESLDPRILIEDTSENVSEVENTPTTEQVPVPTERIEVTSENTTIEESVSTTRQVPVPTLPVEVSTKNSVVEESLPTAELVPVPTVLVEVTSENSVVEENVPTTEVVSAPTELVEVTSENSVIEESVPTTELVPVPTVLVETTSEIPTVEENLPATEQNVVPIEVNSGNTTEITTVQTPVTNVTIESATEIRLVPTTGEALDNEILQDTGELTVPVASIDNPSQIAKESNTMTMTEDQSVVPVGTLLR